MSTHTVYEEMVAERGLLAALIPWLLSQYNAPLPDEEIMEMKRLVEQASTVRAEYTLDRVGERLHYWKYLLEQQRMSDAARNDFRDELVSKIVQTRLYAKL